jgi:predicted transcriptional regulator/transcriptional regulator with XRE-family HTH domain
LPIGQRIRESRQALGINQSKLAQLADISASYLNLIEHDKRQIGGALVKRIATALDVPLGRLSGAEDAPLANEVSDLARTLSIAGLDEVSAARFVAHSPDWADAMRQLYRRYRDATETALALSDRLSQDPALMELSHAVLTQISAIRSFAEILQQYPDLEAGERERFSGIIAEQSDRLGSSAREMIALLDGAQNTPTPTSPQSEVDDFIHRCGNHLPLLEEAAERLRRQLGTMSQPLSAAIEARLVQQHGLSIRRGQPVGDVMRSTPVPGILRLDEAALDSTIRFQLARALVEREMGGEIEDLVIDDYLTSDEARAIARRAMANYAAGALLFAYDPFFEAAEACRYDLDRLGQQFGGSFEQIAHRLVTLRRPDATAVPFAFLRSDPAGNISKPFSIQGLRVPRMGGACPLWALYRAHATPDRTIAQLAEMPSGEHYLFIARSQSKRAPAFGGEPVRYSVMLGCDAHYGDRLVYFDSFASGKRSLASPVGFTCRSCPRDTCPQRAQPSILSTPKPL